MPWHPPRHLPGLLAFFVVAGLVAAWRIDDLLHALHLPGEPSYGMADVASFDPDDGKAAVAGWTRAEVADRASAERITGAYLLADTVVAVALPALLALLARGAAGLASTGRAELGRLVGLVPGLALALALTDLTENLVLRLATDGGEPAASLVVAAAALGVLKWLLLALVVFAVVVPRLMRAVAEREARERWREPLGAVRLQIVVAVLFAGLLHGPIAGEQSADVMLRWVQFGDTEWIDALLGITFTLWLGGVVYGACRALLLQDRVAPAERMSPWAAVGAGFALVVLGAVGELVAGQLLGLVVLGAIVMVYGSLGFLRGDADLRCPRGDTPTRLPLVVGAVPAVALGLAMQSAALGEYVYTSEPELLLLLGFGAALQLAGWIMVADTPRLDAFVSPVARWLSHGVDGARPQANTGVLVSAGALALLAVRIWTDPWRISDLLGTVAIFAAFCTAAALIAFAVSQPEQRRQPPAVLSALGMRRHPIVLGLVAWLALVFTLGTADESYHDARVARTGQSLGIATVEDTWTRWLATNGLDAPAAATPARRRRATPLVLVATSGGGIRAAYWTANALDRVFTDTPSAWPHVFAISGASGGSVGTAFYAAKVLRGGDTADWVEHRLGADHLAPIWAWTLFADIPQGVGLFDAGRDRAEVLERSFEQSWTGRDAIGGLLDDDPQPSGGPLATGLRRQWLADETAPAARRLPLFLFNATSVRDGCRINVSVLDADLRRRGRAEECLSLDAFERPLSPRGRTAALGATEDVVDLLCDSADLRLSTASTLSARFPFVTPSGRLDDCDEDAYAYAVDGGYFDNTGASALVELWTGIGPRVAEFNATSPDRCVVPVVLQLDNTYEQASPPDARGRPAELSVPLKTAMNVIGIGPGREASAKQNLGIVFDRPSAAAGIEPYARLYPLAHPGTSPPLGWTLSRISMDDMDKQLALRHNRRALERMRRWFSPDLTCGPRPG